MEENRKFENVKDHRTEFFTDGGRFYTFVFDDGAERSFILSSSEIRDFLKSKYEEKAAAGEVYAPDQYEEKREEYLLAITNK